METPIYVHGIVINFQLSILKGAKKTTNILMRICEHFSIEKYYEHFHLTRGMLLLI